MSRHLLIILLGLASLACTVSARAETQINPLPAATEPTASGSQITAILASTTPTPAPLTCTVVSEALHVRISPDVTGTILGYLTAGESIERLTATPQGDWVQVRAQALTGWVHSRYLNCTQEAAATDTNPLK